MLKEIWKGFVHYQTKMNSKNEFKNKVMVLIKSLAATTTYFNRCVANQVEDTVGYDGKNHLVRIGEKKVQMCCV